MPEIWYEKVGPDTRLLQGDLIIACPLIAWQDNEVEVRGSFDVESLQGMITAVSADVVVMTQSCDLEQNKVKNVLLCPHISLHEFREYWACQMQEKGQNPTEKAWRKICDDICDGFIWNITMLNAYSTNELTVEHRVVDFREVFTVPRIFLESLLNNRAQPRLRLRPPYREHLSQAFARFFMRVGLPVPVTPAW